MAWMDMHWASIVLAFESLLYLFAVTGMADRAPTGTPPLDLARALPPSTIAWVSIGRDGGAHPHWTASRAALRPEERDELDRYLEQPPLPYGFELDVAHLRALASRIERLHVVVLDVDDEGPVASVVVECTSEAEAVALFEDPRPVLPLDEKPTPEQVDGVSIASLELGYDWTLGRHGSVLVFARPQARAVRLLKALATPPEQSLATEERYRRAAPALAGPGPIRVYFDHPSYFDRIHLTMPRSERQYRDLREAALGHYDLGALAGRVRVGTRGFELAATVGCLPDSRPVATWLPAGGEPDRDLLRVLGPDTVLAAQFQLADPAAADALRSFLAEHHAGDDDASGVRRLLQSCGEAALGGRVRGSLLVALGAHQPLRQRLDLALREAEGKVVESDAYDREMPLMVALRAVGADQAQALLRNIAQHENDESGGEVVARRHPRGAWCTFGDPARAGVALGDLVVVSNQPARIAALLDQQGAEVPLFSPEAFEFPDARRPVLRVCYDAPLLLRSLDRFDLDAWGYFDVFEVGGGAIKRPRLVFPRQSSRGALGGSFELERSGEEVRVHVGWTGPPGGATRLLAYLRQVQDVRRLAAICMMGALYYALQRYEGTKGQWPESFAVLDAWGQEEADYNGFPSDWPVVNPRLDPSVPARQRVLAYTRATCLHGGRAVLSADGLVRWVDAAAWAALAAANRLGDDPPLPRDE